MIINFLKAVLLSVLVFTMAESCVNKSTPGIDSERPVTELQPVELSRPSWCAKEPVIMVGNWDAAPIYRIRKGGNPEWNSNEYDKEHSEEAVKKLKEMGVTMAIIHFYKGFGLEAEKEQMEDSKKLASLLKKYGIRVGVYVGSTIFYETFFLERPDAADWCVPDYLGRPVRYSGTQTFRKVAYFMHPGYIEYLKNVVQIAIQELHADLIHFDNASLSGTEPVFFHPLAIRDFRTFLRYKYTPEMLKKRLGFSDVRYVDPPMYDKPLSTIDDPLFQEWADFRCQQLANYYEEMRKFIHSLNPEVAVDNNPAPGLDGTNTIWKNSIDFPRLLSSTDYVWNESGDEAGYSDNGVLISRIRSYKAASGLNNSIFTYTGDSKLQMAEAMAYNPQCMGMVGGLLAGYELTERRDKTGFDNPYTWGAYNENYGLMKDKAHYISFYRNNFSLYRDIKNIADVAVLRSFATLAYNNNRPYQSTFLFEQTLIQEKIPFDIIYDNRLKDLSKYKVLVLADQECLTDNNMELIRQFVRNGGGVVATEHTSLYSEWRQRKVDFGLKDLFKTHAPEWIGGRVPAEKVLNIPVLRNQIGTGRVVYIPEVKPAIEKPPAGPMYNRYWKLPLNWKELAASVKWAAGNDLSADINAPQTVTMELYKQETTGYLLLHLINYNFEKQSEIKGIEVALTVPEANPVKEVQLLSPDLTSVESISFVRKGDKINFRVPSLYTYDLLVIK